MWFVWYLFLKVEIRMKLIAGVWGLLCQGSHGRWGHRKESHVGQLPSWY